MDYIHKDARSIASCLLCFSVKLSPAVFLLQGCIVVDRGPLNIDENSSSAIWYLPMTMAAGGDAQPATEPAATRDWSELLRDAIASVFAKLGPVDILMGAGLVCHSWLDAAMVPYLWRSVDFSSPNIVIVKEKCGGGYEDVLRAMAKKVVDRSDGQLEVFIGEGFVVDDGLLNYIGEKCDIYLCNSMEARGDAKPATEPAQERDWSELPRDAIASVFAKLGAVDILMGPGLVCHSWLDAAMVPELWRSVDMAGPNIAAVRDKYGSAYEDVLRVMAKKAVDRSNGQLEVAPSLKVLGLISCFRIFIEGFMEAISKFPLLEELKLSAWDLGSCVTYQFVGKACKNLRHFELVREVSWSYSFEPEDLSELPRNAIALVFEKLGPIGILMGAGLLCHSWLDAAMVPELWRSVDMASPNIAIAKMKFWTAMAKKAVDRSDGQLEGTISQATTPGGEHVYVVDEAELVEGEHEEGSRELVFSSTADVSPLSKKVSALAGAIYIFKGQLEAGGDAQPAMEPAATRDWSELPRDAIATVFAKLGAVDILMGAGLVCHSWLDAAMVPELCAAPALRAMARKAVDRSVGQLKVFVGEEFVDECLLKYIAERAPSLKVLGLISCINVFKFEFMDAVTKFPLLEELKLSACPSISGHSTFVAVGLKCKNIRRFEHVKAMCWPFGPNYFEECNHDDEARGIATMHGLRCLMISGSKLTNKALVVILDNSSHLVSVDLHSCPNIVMDDALRTKCAGIKISVSPNQ
ncbi:hypothetical protein HU200_056114 [Digitaria exilis]|uniref:F-box domain-containing protein n=1 Tax=Digitaria exilis TaxID=1010633 RepID=A0A835AHJ0_9POAL|nr:hypothetical protein HU200_056114 [Digitaria exilis]